MTVAVNMSLSTATCHVQCTQVSADCNPASAAEGMKQPVFRGILAVAG
jgi:hypothetical protein